MPKKTSFPVKLTIPTLPPVVERKRLLRRLNHRHGRSVVWITGPPGSGKTTLAASYLKQKKIKALWYQLDAGDADPAAWFSYLGKGFSKLAPGVRRPLPVLSPEYLGNLPTFAQRFFEQFYARVKTPFVLVFDNYHELPSDSPLHRLLLKSIEALPQGGMLLVLSRNLPPSALARLQLEQRVELLEFSDLRFDDREVHEVLQLHKPHLSREDATQWVTVLQQQTKGWIGGVILSLASENEEKAATPPSQDTSVLFDYFATEVLLRQSNDEQVLLQKLSFLPSMTGAMASEFTGDGKTEAILERLARRGYFTERRKETETHYQFHPRFREFLRAYTCSSWEAKQVRAVQEQAAQLLEKHGRTQDAMACYANNAQWTEVLNLLLPNAPVLMAQGRVKTLATWLSSLPAEVVQRNPWCLYWQATCVMISNPEKSVPLFEEVLKQFQQRHEQVGILLAWCGVVNAIQMTFRQYSRLDPWIDYLENYLQIHPTFPSKEIELRVSCSMFGALIKHRFNHSSIQHWGQRVSDNIVHIPDSMTQLQAVMNLYHYRTFNAEYVATQRLLDELHENLKKQPELVNARLMVYAMQSDLSWMKNDAQRCLSFYQQAQQLIGQGNTTDPEIWTSCSGIAGFVLSGQMSKARMTCDALVSKYQKATGMGGVFTNFFAAWIERLTGNHSKAMVYVDHALDLLAQVEMNFIEGFVRSFKVQLHIDYQEWDRVTYEQQILRNNMVRTRCVWNDFWDNIGTARQALLQGEKEKGSQSLIKALSLSREYGCIFWIGMIPDVMAFLCNQALEEGIEEDQAKKIIATLRLSPPQAGASIKWPFPVRIRTLRNFVLIAEQTPKAASPKMPKRPLLFLKVLIALGGKDVPQEKLANILWPDAEGDRAYRSFIVTLTRVRSVLGQKDAIVLENGRVSLNPVRCWVDALAFEQFVTQADATWQVEQVEESLPLYEQARVLYQGVFLPHDDEELWAQAYRTRLKNRYQHVIDRLRAGYEQTGHWGKAVEVLEQTQQFDHLTY